MYLQTLACILRPLLLVCKSCKLTPTTVTPCDPTAAPARGQISISSSPPVARVSVASSVASVSRPTLVRLAVVLTLAVSPRLARACPGASAAQVSPTAPTSSCGRLRRVLCFAIMCICAPTRLCSSPGMAAHRPRRSPGVLVRACAPIRRRSQARASPSSRRRA